MILSHRTALSLVAQELPDPGPREPDTAMTRMLRAAASKALGPIAGMTKALHLVCDAVQRAAVPVARSTIGANYRRGLTALPAAVQCSTGMDVHRTQEARLPGKLAQALQPARRRLAPAPAGRTPAQKAVLQLPSIGRAQAAAGHDRPSAAPPLQPFGRLALAAVMSGALGSTARSPVLAPQRAAQVPVRAGAARDATLPVIAGLGARSLGPAAATSDSARPPPVSSSATLRAIGAGGTARRDAGPFPPASRLAHALAGGSREKARQRGTRGRGAADARGLAGAPVSGRVAAAQAAVAGPGAASARQVSLLLMQRSAAVVSAVASNSVRAPLAGAGSQPDLQHQVIPPANIARRAGAPVNQFQVLPEDGYQPQAASGLQAGQGQSVAASPAMVVNLTGDVVLDGRRLGLLTAASQARNASLPAHGQSRVNLRAVPIYSGAQIPR